MMKHPIIDTHKPTRADSEEVLRMLCDSYPKCFFETPRQRRPLKHNITSDIIEDGFGVAPELITAAVDWYQSHIGYAFATTAGDKRIDLEGRPVGTVTEREATSAKQKIDEYNKKQNDLAAKKRQNERAAVESPAKVLGEMYTSGQINEHDRVVVANCYRDAADFLEHRAKLVVS